MYKIRGGDGKEYGPISAETLRSWVNQGRVSGQSPILPEGATQWTTLGACAEFVDQDDFTADAVHHHGVCGR